MKKLERIYSMYSICINKTKQYIGDKLLNDTTGNFARYAWFLERKLNGILNIYQRILIETKMKQLLI
jgi:hypothetical protein